MTTLVGTQANIMDALKELLELDYDAVEAYDAAIERISSESYKSQLNEYKEDHQRHIEDITNILTQHNEEAPTGPSSKKWLTKGKIIIADLIGDESILKAILSNEIDTNTAYERMNERDDTWAAIRDILKKGLEDERRHKKGLEDILNSSNKS